MRIQILHLPSQSVGSVSVSPFALVIDQVETDDITADARLVRRDTTTDERVVRKFAEEVGAAGVLLTPETVEVL